MERFLQQRNSRSGTFLPGILIPDAALHLSDMGAAQKKHAKTALADAAADGVGQFSRQQSLMERKIPAVVAPCLGKLPVQAFGTHSDPPCC